MKKKIFIIGITVILVMLFEPFLFFWLGYFSGWIAKIIIGKYLISGFDIFNIHISLNQIPLLAGILSWIGSFFKTYHYNNNNNNN